MSTMWILIANGSEAHLYSSPKAKMFNGAMKLCPLDDFTHPASRERPGEIESDRPGRYMSRGMAHGSFGGESNAHRHILEGFARELAQQLNQYFHDHEFEELILAAPPEFHGYLRKFLDAQTREAVTIHIEKDYTRCTPKELSQRLQVYL